MTKLAISPGLSLPLDFVTSTNAILAKKRSGKSYTAQVTAEELLDAKQQIVALDPTGAWWGLRAGADGKSGGYPIAVLGGEHGDVPLEAAAGEMIASAVVSERFSCVIDTSLFTVGEEQRFAAAFLATLYRLNREAMHLFVDEADVFAPQKPFGEEAKTLGAMQNVVRRGGLRGIGVSLITQRPQVLNKDVLSQVDMLTTLRMNHPKDLGAIEDWVAVHGDPDRAKQMIKSLPSLPVGDAWVWAPAQDIFQRLTIRRKQTYDSGRTPKAGERVQAPKVLAQVDIARLGQAIAATAERAKAEDPKALRARIRQLEADLAARNTAMSVERVVEVPVPVAPPGVVSLVEDFRISMSVALEKFNVAFTAAIAPHVEAFRETNEKLSRLAGRIELSKHPATPSVTMARLASRRETVQASADGGGELSRMERAMLTTLAQHPTGLTKRQIRVQTGYAESGPVSKCFARLGAERWIETAGAALVITKAGLKALGAFTPLPVGDELRKSLLDGSSKLSTMERAMLRVICDSYPDPIAKSKIREAAGYAESGPVSRAFAHLVALDYVAKVGPEIWIVEVKTSLSLALVVQAFERKAFAHRIWIAAPHTRSAADTRPILEALGIGLMLASGRFDGAGRVQVSLDAPQLTSKRLKLAERLYEGNKTHARAGAPGGAGRWTPFRQTCEWLARIVRQTPGITLREAIKEITHHYASDGSARGALTRWIETGKVDGVRLERVDRDVRLFPVEAAKEAA